MSRLKKTIDARLAAGGKLLIPYIVAGDPDCAISLRLMHEMVAQGADIIELGVPFSDPSSDGAVIQQGSERALAGGTTLRDVLALVTDFRKDNLHTPIVLMGYLNPVEIMGYELFARQAAAAGVDGVLLVDMPPSESRTLASLLRAQQVDTVFLVAPTTSMVRAKSIASHCTGYLYYVSLKGVTGAAINDTDSIRDNIQQLRGLSDLPIVIGFGIKDEQTAAAMAELADGVVMGSALVAKIAALQRNTVPDDGILRATVALIASSRARLDGFK
jgi:tryptophan synthase alpha chain